MSGKSDSAAFLPPADIVGMPADQLTELLDQVLAEDEPAPRRPSSSGLLAVAEAAAQTLPGDPPDASSQHAPPEGDGDLVPQLRIARAVLANPEPIDGHDTGAIVLEAPVWNHPAPPPARLSRRRNRQKAQSSQPPSEPINHGAEAEAALLLAEIGTRPLTGPGGWTADADTNGATDFPVPPETEYIETAEAILTVLAPETAAFIPAVKPADLDLLMPGESLASPPLPPQPSAPQRQTQDASDTAGPDLDLLGTVVASDATGGAEAEALPSLSSALFAQPRPPVPHRQRHPRPHPSTIETTPTEAPAALPAPAVDEPAKPVASVALIAAPARKRKKKVTTEALVVEPVAPLAAPSPIPAPTQQPAVATPPSPIKASLKPARRPHAPKAPTSPPPEPASPPPVAMIAPPVVEEAPPPPPMAVWSEPPPAATVPELPPAPARPEPEPPLEVAAESAMVAAPAPQQNTPPETAPTTADQPESGLAAWAEVIIAASRGEEFATMARPGSPELPPNQAGLEELLADPPPATDFAALDLLAATWGKATQGSDRRALLATAYNLSRNFGLPGKLPMASSRAWRMLDARVFRSDISNQLHRVAEFIADWQKTQKTFLILEHGEIELIEFLFESLDPAEDLDQMAAVMNFKVLSNRRMGLIRRIPSRLRKQVQAILPAGHQEALIMLAHYKALLERLADPNGFAPIVETAGKMLEEIEKLMKMAAAASAPQLPPGAPPGAGGGQPLGRIG